MSRNQIASNPETSLIDSFLMAVLGMVPLLATAAIPAVSRPLTQICLAAAALVGFNWVVAPLARWTWRRVHATSARLAAPRYSRSR
jgi:hypothetical protein